MDAQMILATARSGQMPSDWNVWPLNIASVRRGLYGWIVTALVGFVLLIPVTMATVPSNFKGGAVAIFFTLLLVGVLAMVAFGGLWFVVYDIWRLSHADGFLLVMTPEDFVKVTPRTLVHVPMEYISGVTLRGVKSLQQHAAEDVRGVGSTGHMPVMMRMPTRQPKSPPSLAFLDTRDDSAVTVATDDSFESLIVLEQILSDYVYSFERRRRA